MTSTWVVKTSVNVTLNSPSQDYTHPDDHNLSTKVVFVLLFLGPLYSKCSEILTVLRNFFDGTSIKEENDTSRDVDVSSAALFAKLGMLENVTLNP